MSDLFYRIIRLCGRPVFWLCSTYVALGREHVPRRGPCIIASTHESPYDIPLIIRHTPRLVDFVSITEVFQNPFLAWFYGSLNAFPLDRSRPDSKTVRILLDRVKRARAVTMFPEGRLSPGDKSVLHTRRIRKGIGRLARLAAAPVIPCVIINSPGFGHAASWLPIRRTRYGVIYGEPLTPDLEPEELEARLIEAYVTLHQRLTAAMANVPRSSRHGPSESHQR